MQTCAGKFLNHESKIQNWKAVQEEGGAVLSALDEIFRPQKENGAGWPRGLPPTQKRFDHILKFNLNGV